MTYQIQTRQSKLDKSMSEEQFEQIVEAILAGKYSWACVLILRFTGYNPLHYIPYRTYNRLLKDNALTTPSNRSSQASEKPAARKISDLAYLDQLRPQAQSVRGGSGLFQLWNHLF